MKWISLLLTIAMTAAATLNLVFLVTGNSSHSVTIQWCQAFAVVVCTWGAGAQWRIFLKEASSEWN